MSNLPNRKLWWLPILAKRYGPTKDSLLAEGVLRNHRGRNRGRGRWRCRCRRRWNLDRGRGLHRSWAFLCRRRWCRWIVADPLMTWRRPPDVFECNQSIERNIRRGNPRNHHLGYSCLTFLAEWHFLKWWRWSWTKMDNWMRFLSFI